MANFDVKEVGIDALFPDKDEDIYKQQGINAQIHPEKYPTLMVRVAGYSVYFTDLSTTVQNDIINRTEHHL